MFLSIHSLLPLLLLLAAISIDTFAAGFSYGCDHVKIPFSSTCIMSAISGIFLSLAIQSGLSLKQFLPASFLRIFSFLVLLLLGIYRLIDMVRAELRKKSACYKTEFSHPAACPAPGDDIITKTIRQANKGDPAVLSPRESIFLGIALSLDNIAAGFGFQGECFSPAAILVTAAAVHFLIIRAGCLTGRKISACTTLSFSWVGTVLLFLLAFSRLIF